MVRRRALFHFRILPLVAITLSTILQTCTAQSPVTVVDAGNGFSWVGCYQEPPGGGRAINDANLRQEDTGVNMTVEICSNFCSGYNYMGVEYGQECYCGNSVNNASQPVSTESRHTCTDPLYACTGNSSEFCGGYSTIDLYAKPGETSTVGNPMPAATDPYQYTFDSYIVPSVQENGTTYNYIGCYTDPSVLQRALNGPSSTYGYQTVEACAGFCSNYTYFGLEDGGECFCGNSIDNGATLADCQGECYQCCADELSERCGGYFRLSMYGVNGTFIQPSQTAPCTYNGPATVVQTAGSSYTYYGPITTGSTVVAVVTTDSAGRTTGYSSTEYYCDGGCNTNDHTPGGTITGYHQPTSSPATATAKPTSPPSVGLCAYVNCYDDYDYARTLSYPQTQLNSSQMTVEICIRSCSDAGFLYGGVEYGQQCFCGYAITSPHAPVYPGEETAQNYSISCSDPAYACTGDSTEQCGGFAAIDIYFCPQNLVSSSSAVIMQTTRSSAVMQTPLATSGPLFGSSGVNAITMQSPSSRNGQTVSSRIASSYRNSSFTPGTGGSTPMTGQMMTSSSASSHNPSLSTLAIASSMAMTGQSNSITTIFSGSGSTCTRRTIVVPIYG